jgi:hypothetical protein
MNFNVKTNHTNTQCHRGNIINFIRSRAIQVISAFFLQQGIIESPGPGFEAVSLQNFCGVRLCFGYSLPQTPLVWEPLALGLPFLRYYRQFAWHLTVLGSKTNGSVIWVIKIRRQGHTRNFEVCKVIRGITEFYMAIQIIFSYTYMRGAYLLRLINSLNCWHHTFPIGNIYTVEDEDIHFCIRDV